MRYPGGKSKALSKIISYFPKKISEFREPLVGGGSLFIYVRQKYPEIKVRINDLNEDVYCFWKITKEDNKNLVDEIKDIKKKSKNGKKLFHNLKSQLELHNIPDFERAAYFFILNRISFSGLNIAGGYSHEAFKKRFTHSSIERISLVKDIMRGVEIFCGDYSYLLNGSEKDVFIYLDPPYLKTKDSKLYGKNGSLHFNFDHNLFYENILKCNHKLLITYDNSKKIRTMYSIHKKFNIFPLNFQYGMNNISKNRIPSKKELIIINYKKDNLLNQTAKDTFLKYNIADILKKKFALNILFKIDKSVNFWKSLDVLKKEVYQELNKDFLTPHFNYDCFFHYFIEKLIREKFLDISFRKGIGQIIIKLYKWNVDNIIHNIF